MSIESRPSRISGLGYWWPWQWYTVNVEGKYKPLRKLSSTAADEWWLDEKQANWDASIVTLLRYDSGTKRWVKVRP